MSQPLQKNLSLYRGDSTSYDFTISDIDPLDYDSISIRIAANRSTDGKTVINKQILSSDTGNDWALSKVRVNLSPAESQTIQVDRSTILSYDIEVTRTLGLVVTVITEWSGEIVLTEDITIGNAVITTDTELDIYSNLASNDGTIGSSLIGVATTIWSSILSLGNRTVQKALEWLLNNKLNIPGSHTVNRLIKLGTATPSTVITGITVTSDDDITGARFITGSATPTDPSHLTRKDYVDGIPEDFLDSLGGSTGQVLTKTVSGYDMETPPNADVEAYLDALDGRLDTAESDIESLEGRTDDIETELLSVATLKNSIDYSKIIGELFTLDFPKTPSFTFNPASPRTYFPAVNLTEIDVTITVDNTDVPQAFLDHLRSVYLIYLPGKSGEVFQWAVTVSGSDITFPNTTSANAMLAALFEDKEVQGTFTNHRTVNIDGTDYAITAINLVTRVVTVSGSPTTGSQTAQFFHHRIAGSTTTARLFEVSGESYIATGDADGYFIAGLRTRGYFQGHRMAPLPGSGPFAVNRPGSLVFAPSSAGNFDGTTGDPVTDGVNGIPRTRKTTHSPGLSGIPYQWCGA